MATFPLSRCGVIALMFVALAGSVASRLSAADVNAGKSAVVIRFEGEIGPFTEAFLNRKLAEAKSQNPELLIIEIESPGGRVDTTLRICNTLESIEWARVIAYIPGEAYSGAAFVALACDEIAMSDHAAIGDAGPIQNLDGTGWEHVSEKIRSPLVSKMRSMAEARGRPPALAEAMVSLKTVVYKMTNPETGEVRYLSENEIEGLEDAEQWTKGAMVEESREDLFLTVSGKRAVELGLADVSISSQENLKQHYAIGNVHRLEFNGFDATIWIMNTWIVSFLLIVIGLIALYIELSAPGFGGGGLVSAICFVLFFWSRFLGGTAEWLEVLLFITGIVFIGLELFVIPGFGVTGVTGLLLIVVSMILACQDFFIPESGRQLSSLAGSMSLVVASGVIFIVAAYFISSYIGSVPVLNQLVLAPLPATHVSAVESEPLTAEGKPAPVAPLQYSVGDWGVADSPLRPAGKAKFGDEYLDVLTDGSFVESGKQVKIIKIEGNRIIVREVDG